MTPAEAISMLDTEIAYIKAIINRVSFSDGKDIERLGNHLKDRMVKTIRKTGGRESALLAIKTISFENAYSGPVAAQFYGQQGIEAGLKRCFQEGVDAIITILQQEREYFIRVRQEQEKQKEHAFQKRSNRIQIWTLITSIVAIILSAVSLCFTIFF